MLKLIFLAFFSIPLHQRVFQINNADVVFNGYLNDLLIGCSAAGYFLSNYWKKEKICNTDDDCPDIHPVRSSWALLFRHQIRKTLRLTQP